MSSLRERYDRAILEWAWAIDNMPGLCGMLMGRASSLRKQLGFGMDVMSANLRSAQHHLDTRPDDDVWGTVQAAVNSASGEGRWDDGDDA